MASTFDFKITVKEPTYAEAFYGTSNGQYSGHWNDGTRGDQVGNVPKISDILGARKVTRGPVRPIQTTAKTILADQIEAAFKANQSDKVLCADKIPKKFPVQAHQFSYPVSAKHGHDNPLYQVSSQVYGSVAPMAHQLPERHFPGTNQFTKVFTDLKPRYSGLSTAPTPSKVHTALNEYY
jgi:hypothetical protein